MLYDYILNEIYVEVETTDNIDQTSNTLHARESYLPVYMHCAIYNCARRQIAIKNLHLQ